MRLPADLARVLVSLAFLAHGVLFVAPPSSARERMLDGPLTLTQFRLLGEAEIAGALAFALPLVTDALGWLAVAAGLGLLGVLVPAAMLHARRREWSSAVLTSVLMAMTALALAAPS